MVEKDVLQIDVEAVIHNKSPKLLKRLPRFVIRYLKKIIHQDEINVFLKDQIGVMDHDFVDAVIEFMEITPVYEGFDNVPENGRFIFASNHPLGGLESIALMHVVAKKDPNFVFVVNDILMALTPFKNLFVPINKHGSQSRKSVEIINECYESDKQILFFPAGLVSRKRKGKIRDPQWQKSFIAKAVKTKRDIIPVYIEGRNSNFFYNLANLRKFFGIKANLEMLYLVNESFKQRGRTIKITFGKPIPYSTFDKSKSYNEWASYLQEKVYGMREG